MIIQSKWLQNVTNEFLNIEDSGRTIICDLKKEAREYPQDISREKLEILKTENYVKVTWKTSQSAVDSKCLELNNNFWTIDDFLSQTAHDAPIYSKSHVGCTCSLIVEGENLDPIEIWALY